MERLLSNYEVDFIHHAYSNLLGRAPEAEEYQYYLQRIQSGIGKIEILNQIRNSPEGQKNKNNQMSGPALPIKTSRSDLELYKHLHKQLHESAMLPISRNFGVERGTPVGRYYIDLFLKKHSASIKGRCLEFGGTTYKSYFPNTDEYKVLSIAEGSDVDYVGDVHDIDSLPRAKFDSIICTQVFEHLAKPHIAARSLYSMLKPGGVLLFTAPFIANIHYSPTDFFRFTPDGCRFILETVGFKIVDIDYGGNSMVSAGSLLGMVAEDFTQHELATQDPIYPYINLIKAIKPDDIEHPFYKNIDLSIAQAMTCKGWTSHEKLACLARLLNETDNIPGDILEIGSAWGRSTIFMATYSPKKLWSIDPHTGGLMYINANINQDSYLEFVNNLIRCNVYDRVSLLTHTTEEVLLNNRIPDNVNFSLIFIDGLHTPEGVDFDFKLALKHLSPSGIIVFDDYFSPEFRDYADEIDLLMEKMGLYLIKDESGLVYCTIDANSCYAINDLTLFNNDNSLCDNHQPKQYLNKSSIYNSLKLRDTSPMRSNLLSKIKSTNINQINIA